MERTYNHQTGTHELTLSSEELELVYRGLKALAGAALLQSSTGNSTIDMNLLNTMREFTAREGF